MAMTLRFNAQDEALLEPLVQRFGRSKAQVVDPLADWIGDTLAQPTT